MNAFYPIGTPGQPWGEPEKSAWRASQKRQRSYADDVLSRIDALRPNTQVEAYGEIDWGVDGRFPVYAIRSQAWDDSLPCALVTGGVHGYETSGVHGALDFVQGHLADYDGRINVLVVPCISPWAYERIQRWNPLALDPNRNFIAASPCAESAAVMRLVEPLAGRFIVHIDLHETTDTDESEFRPAKSARDGQPFEPDTIPDGFYLCGDSADPQAEFQQAVIAAVAKVTHIAPPDAKNEIIGSPVVAHGVINYPYRELGLCAGVTDARYRTTTEVYPDSPRATPAECNAAQVAAVRAALDYALAHR
ncbi:M14 family metallocarboxypeptidase [Arenimonas sp.]|uniref:M14 family metallopeptidase n=1 Tax=Arenimonas sp. TaxID=1872635 RepID=UPI0025D5ED38|nr:M14 family metallocarboxypeptidase [Arenimonas sp.]